MSKRGSNPTKKVTIGAKNINNLDSNGKTIIKKNELIK